MIEISLGKMVLLALIALIVLGPEKLPGAARTAGALLRRVRSGWDNVRAEVERELEIEEIRRTAREAAAHAESAQSQLKDTLRQAHDPFAEAAAMVRLQSPKVAEAQPAAGLPLQNVPAQSQQTATLREEAAESAPCVQPELPLQPPGNAPHGRA